MAEESGVAGEGGVRGITELRVVDLKAELKRRSLDTSGNKSVLIERLRQVIEEEGGNPDELSVTPDTLNSRTSKRTGKGQRAEDGETEDSAEEDFAGKQERKEATGDPAEGEQMQVNEETETTLEEPEKENVAENSGEAYSSVPTEAKPPEDPRVLMQYMIDMDATYMEEENGNVVQMEDRITLDEAGEMQPEGPKMESDYMQEKVNAEKMDTTESNDKMESHQQKHEVDEGESKGAETEPLPRFEECKTSARNPEDEGSNKAEKKEPSIVEGSDQKSSEDGKDIKNETSEKEEPGSCRTSDATGKNLWVSGLSSTTRATDLKNLFSKHGKVICAKVVTDARNPGARCYGFITMLTPEEATECISSLNQSELNGQTITVELAKSDPSCKKPAEQKAENMNKVSKPSSSRRSGHDRDHSRDGSSVNGKRDDQKDSGDDGKLEDVRRNRRRARDDGSRSYSRYRDLERSRERRRSRSRSRQRRFQNRDRGRNFVSFDKLIAMRERERGRERERHWDHRRDFWEMERFRERDIWERESRREREGREMLERERSRLQIERMRLERERLEREALERERLLIEEERRREQERIHREKEQLFREMHYEQSMRRPYDRPYERPYERFYDRPYERPYDKPYDRIFVFSFSQGWNSDLSQKMDRFPDHSWQEGMDNGMMSRNHWQGDDRDTSGQSGTSYTMHRGGQQNQGNYVQRGFQPVSTAFDNC
ncbi:scaffold attachment factor B1-like isoform X4 [Mobula birostris]|uniref:scaffold attachment factor B1-like isoform X4 n=1 Tax=Mobula birostris TaxID=1983395 RepID=UPI003B281DBD